MHVQVLFYFNAEASKFSRQIKINAIYIFHVACVPTRDDTKLNEKIRQFIIFKFFSNNNIQYDMFLIEGCYFDQRIKSLWWKFANIDNAIIYSLMLKAIPKY